MESQMQASHPFHRPWESRKTGAIPHIPTASTTILSFLGRTENPALKSNAQGWARINCRSGPSVVAKRTPVCFIHPNGFFTSHLLLRLMA
jgi:hypothetical protein